MKPIHAPRSASLGAAPSVVLLAVLLSATLALAACGGGGSAEPADAPGNAQATEAPAAPADLTEPPPAALVLQA